MADIGTAYVQIEPTAKGISGKISGEMDSAGQSASKDFGGGFTKGLGSAMGGAGKVMAGAVAAGGAALVGMGAELVKASGDVASYGDNIDKMSQKMGLSAEAYQEWDAVMQHSGTSMEAMKSSMKTLANAAEGGNKAFEQIGLTQEQIASMSQQDLFEATIAGLQNVEDTTQRTYLAGQLLGRGATELGALLNTSAEDTQAMRDRVRELGGVMSEDAVKSAAAYQDQLQDMQTAFSGLSRNLISEFLPGLTTVMGGLTEIFSGNTEGGLGMITEGVSGLMENITAAVPQLMTVVGGIVSALGQAIIQNLPTLLSAGIDIIKTLADGILAAIPDMIPVILDVITQIGNMIIELAPVLIEAGLNIIVQLALGIAQSLPELIPTIVEVVLNIALYLLENIDILIDAALQLMIGLATGLINAIPILVEKAPLIINAWSQAMVASAMKLLEVGQKIITVIANAITTYAPQLLSKAGEIINNLKMRFIEAASRFLEVGAAIVNGIKEGIAGAWTQFTNWLYTMLGDIVQGVKDFFKIGSPSKVFADEVGQWIPAGIAEGINEGMSALDDAMVGMEMSISPDQMQGVTSYNPTSQTVTGQGVMNQVYSMLAQYLPIIASGENVNVQLGVDNQQIFKVVQSEAKRNQQITGMGVALI